MSESRFGSSWVQHAAPPHADKGGRTTFSATAISVVCWAWLLMGTDVAWQPTAEAGERPAAGGRTVAAVVDVDVDSDNDDGVFDPERDAAEDGVECDPGHPKFVPVRRDDADLVPVFIEIDPNGAWSWTPGDTVSWAVEYDEGAVHLWRSHAVGDWADAGDADAIRPRATDPPSYQPNYAHALWYWGDMNCDGACNWRDIDFFVAAQNDNCSAYYALLEDRYPGRVCDCYTGDMNLDGHVNQADLDGFVARQNLPPVVKPLRVWCEGVVNVDPPMSLTVVADMDDDGLDPGDANDVVHVQPKACVLGHLEEQPLWNPEPAPLGYECDGSDGRTPWSSRCWPAAWSSLRTPAGNPSDTACPLEPGHGLTISLLEPFGPPDLPPLTLDPARSSIPFVPAEALRQHDGLPSRFATRALDKGVVDCVTGAALLRAVDFELPFAGGAFRHVRTYSDDFHAASLIGSICSYGGGGRVDPHEVLKQGTPDTNWWDWNGTRWMMGENPIFLFNARYQNIVPDDQSYCWFILDAHQAIPFHLEGDQYVAPPWFDASMTHDGADWDPVTREWQVPPSTVIVWLHRGAVCYTIEVDHDDVLMYMVDEDQNCEGEMEGPFRADQQPQDGGFGAPHLGLVTLIEDRYGNRVEYEYADTTWEARDPGEFVNPDPECKYCCQACRRKGQLKAIRLREAGGNVAWTLLYVHRRFYLHQDTRYYSDGGLSRDYHGASEFSKLHAVYAYPYDVDTSPWDALELPAVAFDACIVDQGPDVVFDYDCYDAIDPWDYLPGLPTDWRVSANYLYMDMHWGDHRNLLNSVDYGGQPWCVPGMYLLKCKTVRRPAGASATPEISTTVYRHQMEQEISGAGAEWSYLGGTLQAVFEPATVEMLVARMRAFYGPDANENRLFSWDMADVVPLGDPPNPDTPLSRLADLSLTTCGRTSLPDEQSLAQYCGIDITQNQVIAFLVGPRELTAGETGHGDGNALLKRHYYRFQVTPCDAGAGCYVATDDDIVIQWQNLWGGTIYHYPYRIPSWETIVDGVDGLCLHYPHELLDSDLADVRHVMVVDEEDEDPLSGYDAGGANGPTGTKTRRIIWMNAAGFVLKEQTWSYENDANGQIIDQSGYGEEVAYDEFGRIVERRSAGWSVANDPGNAFDPDTEGLIIVYVYEEAPGGGPDPAGELMAQGVKQGLAGTPYYTDRFYRHPDRRELITTHVVFPDPVSDPIDPELGVTTQWLYEFHDDNPHKGILEKTVIEPATLRPTGAGLVPCHAVARQRFDARGNQTWSGQGSYEAAGGGALGPAVEFYASHTGYDPNGFGLPTIQVYDPDPDDADITYPTGWMRAGYGEPLHRSTTLAFDLQYGPTLVEHADGTETHFIYEPNDPVGRFEWTYHHDAAGVPVEPVTGKFYIDRRLIWTRTYDPTTVEPYGSEMTLPIDDPAAEMISETLAAYDAQGRVTSVGQSGAGVAEGPQADITYHVTGEIARIVNPDGTITRHEYDQRGRLVRTFRGTTDQHGYWGGAPDVPPDDDMALVEKRSYADEGDADACKNVGQLVELRDYRSRPSQAYDSEWVPDPLDPDTGTYTTVDIVDEDAGWTTTYQYDWRGRPVWETQYDRDGAAIANRLTWFDHLDRAVVAAEYGPSVPAGVAPQEAGPGALPPDPQALFGLAEVPLRLSESVYNERGQVEESRRWTADGAGGGTFTATRTYFDHAGRAVETQSPGGGVQRYTYDAKGRQVLSENIARTAAADIVVAWTGTTYDEKDRAVASVHAERALDGVDIPSYTYTWYDDAGRVEATVNFGTNAGDGSFSPGDVPPDYATLASPAVYSGDELVGCDDAAFGDALCNCYGYDEAGRQDAVWHADGTVTRSQYDGLGRLRLEVENADDRDGDGLRRFTAYRYDDAGRVDAIAAVAAEHFADPGVPDWEAVTWDAGDPDLQITWFAYGAPLLADSGTGESQYFCQRLPGVPPDPNLPQLVPYLPEIGTDNSLIHRVTYPDGDELTFHYYLDHSVARREDARGNIVRYRYDERGRLVDTWIEDCRYFYDAVPWLPPNRVHHVAYNYTDDGQLSLVTAYTQTGGVEQIVAQNDFVYDARDNLVGEVQQHFDPVDGNSPFVAYQWEYADAAGDNYDRLAGITYPVSGRQISIGYDDAQSDALCRVTSISDSIAGTLAAYTHIGPSRRVATALGGGVITRSAGAGHMFPGLDRYGRLVDLDYQVGGQTLHRYQYGYDKSGNRTHARVTHADFGGLPHDNDRSWAYAYDALGRLVDADMGQLALSPAPQIVPDANVPLARSLAWSMDELGNWVGDPADPTEPGLARRDDFDGSGFSPPDAWVDGWHAVNSANQITETTTDDGSGPVTTAYVHDAAGNLIFDGRLLYLYDGCNRLVQVNEAGGLTVADFAGAGYFEEIETAPVGPVLARFVYDGLGRLIRTERWDTYQNYESEAFYYDGVRRLVEVDVADPNAPVLREYVWGPDYVDEAVCQFADEDGNPATPATVHYSLQDGNYNVVALVDAAGGLEAQYAYEPYGLLVVVDLDPNAPVNRLGHQGLFFERFYGPFGGPPAPPLSAPALVAADPAAGVPAGLYHNRNRWYSPDLGRFVQRDMNESALPILAVLAMNGAALDAFVSGMDPQGHFGDGANLYLYVGSNPVNALDALGLEWGHDGDVDDLLAELEGHRLYALGALNEGAKWAALGLRAALDIAGALLGLDVFESASLLASGRGGFYEGLDIALAMVPGGGIGRAISKAHKFTRGTRTLGKVARSIDDLAKLSRRWRSGIDMAKLEAAKADYPKKALKKQWHHLIPKYLGGSVSGPKVRINSAYHQKITNAFRREWRYGNPAGKPDPAELERILDRVYTEFPLPR